MPTMEHNWYRRSVFFTVYLVETIITLVTLSYFPILFSSKGINMGLYGLVGSLSLFPMVFKFFIGPLSDKFPIPFLRGKRRGYIILGALLNIIFLPLLSLDPLNFFVLFFVVWFFQTLGIAIMDVLTDALAVSAKPIQNLRGRTGASIWMFLGIFVGGAIASAFVGVLESNLLFGLCIFSTISVVPLLLVVFLKEKTEDTEPSSNLVVDIKRNLKHPFVKMGLLFAFLLNLDGGLLELNLEAYLNATYGMGAQEIVSELFFIALLGALIGLAGYMFIDRFKKNRVLIVISIIYVIPSLLLGYLIFSGLLTYELFLILYGFYGIVSSLSLITYMGLFFDLSDPKAAGTMIALFLTVTNGGMIIGVAIGGFLPLWLIYFIVAIICVVRIIPLLKIKMEDIEKTFYQKEE